LLRDERTAEAPDARTGSGASARSVRPRTPHDSRAMIVTTTEDRRLRSLLLRAARADEDVVWGERATSSLLRGFPRLRVTDRSRRPARARSVGERGTAGDGRPPLLVVTPALLAQWEARWCREVTGRRRGGTLKTPDDLSAERLRMAIRERARSDLWVDRTLAHLSKAAGRPLPASLCGFARRAMEDPAHYSETAPLAAVSGMSRGALKGRFRRRGLASPYTHLRWFRVLAIARLLEEPATRTMDVAHRLRLSHSGNVSRMVRQVSGETTTDLRTEEGRNRLVLKLSDGLLRPAALEAWDALGELFLRKAAA